MKVNPQQLMDDGYIIIRECIPSEQLDGLRDSFEVLLERQTAIWEQARSRSDDPSTIRHTSRTPRLKPKLPRLAFQTVVDEKTANTVEFCLHENTLGVCRQLMRAPEAAVSAMFFLCNPDYHHGSDGWHRDVQPWGSGPLEGLQMDMLANGPGSLQWNIPLYDDDVFWVTPGSHIRLNTPEENRQLLENPHVPLPGSTPVKLKGGDGVVYSSAILHWGSDYSTKLRRTIHLGYRAFGGPIFPYNYRLNWDLDFTRHLSPQAREAFVRFAQLYAKERDMIASLFRAIVDKDAPGFRESLATLHPGEQGRIASVVLLHRLADKIRALNSPDMANRPSHERAEAIGEVGSFYWQLDDLEDIAYRFSPSETEALWEQFGTLDAKLQSDTEQFTPDTQFDRRHYAFNKMPANFDVEDFIASW